MKKKHSGEGTIATRAVELNWNFSISFNPTPYCPLSLPSSSSSSALSSVSPAAPRDLCNLSEV